jgi:hypothetical protein
MTQPSQGQTPAPNLPSEGVVSSSVLQDQLREIIRQLERNQQVRENLMDRSASVGIPARDALAKQIAGIDAANADLQARFSDIVGKIAQAEAQNHFSQMTLPPPPPEFPPPNAYGIDPQAITAVFLLLSIAIIVPLSLGLTRRLWRRPQQAPPAPDTETISKARLDRLEQAVDTIAIEIERISEGQRFVTRVLTERPASVRPAANDAPETAALGEGTPFLALGAGPMEPVPVAQRQAVKQSITPH